MVPIRSGVFRTLAMTVADEKYGVIAKRCQTKSAAPACLKELLACIVEHDRYSSFCLHSPAVLSRGNRTDPSQPIDTLVSRILQSTADDPFHVPDDKDAVRKILFRLASRLRSIENELKHYRSRSPDQSPLAGTESSPAPDATTPPSTEPTEPITSLTDLSKQLAGFTIGFPKKIHFGESSNVTLVMAAIDHRKGLSVPEWQSIFAKTRRPELWKVPSYPGSDGASESESPRQPSYNFPDQDSLRTLVNLYFDENNIYFPLLHRQTFERSIAEGLHLHDAGFGALVLIVCATAARLVMQSPNGESGWNWFSQIPLEKMVLGDNMSLYHVQMFILTALYLKGVTARPNSGWVLTGIAIRVAQERGVHRRNTDNSQPTAESELWKRAFWMLLTLDTRLSSFFGRPRATSWQDFDLGPLIECDDEYWETEDPEQAFKQPEGKPSVISYWNCYCRLIEIVGLSQGTIYSVRKSQLQKQSGLSTSEWYEKMVMELDSALNQWADSVPDHLRWDTTLHSNEILFSQSAILYREISISLPSLTICTNAARSLVKVCETHYRRRPIPYSEYMVVPLFNAAMVLTVNLWRLAGIKASTNTLINFDSSKEMEWIQKCIELMETQEPKSSLSGRMVDIIKTVIWASHHTPPSTQNSISSDQTEPVFETTTEQAQAVDQPGQFNIAHFNDSSNTYLPFYTRELGSFDPYTYYSQNSSQPGGPFGGFDFGSESFDAVNAAQTQTLSSQGNLHTGDLAQYFALANGHGNGQPDFASNGTIGANISNRSVDMHVADMDMSNMSWPGDPSYAQDWDSFMQGVDRMLKTGTSAA
ncbi:hypothetical protein D9758_005086 [Tetrapyrgos nigripes]|uniref:Xylanolytic transcriptional activator regulatory domain-containing protein n=1 Tax=Tetrapyrgos nigripes TaxID=182062 RepID=A0A8H5GW85_9AGAR|nr:hypothetical protein D9758_005086 [Tetrapyrgos nigripes]